MRLNASTASNVVLGLWLLSDAGRIILTLQFSAYAVADALMVVALSYLAIRVFVRRKAIAISTDVISVAATLAGTFIPFLYVVIAELRQPTSDISAFLQTASALGVAWSAFALGENFSLLPNYRALVVSGPYAYIRHPFYAFYIIFDLTLVIETLSVLVATIWIVEIGLLFWRAKLEERLLAESCPEYAEYCQKVRYRLIPGVT